MDIERIAFDKDQTMSINTNKEDSIDLKIQKRLAKIILDFKYESGMSQTTVNMLLSRFRMFFNESVDLYEETVSCLIGKHTIHSHIVCRNVLMFV